MRACRDTGIKEVFLTCWGDDGMECDIYSALPAFQLFAEYGYAEKIDIDNLRANFQGSCNADYDAWVEAGKLDVVPAFKRSKDASANPSRALLYGDTLLGI